MRKLVCLISFVVVLAMASNAFALTFGVEVTSWTGAVSRDWMDPANWSLGVPDPLVNANTQIGPAANTPLISAGQNASTSAFDTWGPELGGHLDIEGGTYGTPPGSSPAFIGLNLFSPPASPTSVLNLGWSATMDNMGNGHLGSMQGGSGGAIEVGEFMVGDNWWGDGGYNVVYNQYSGTATARGWMWLGGKMNLYGGTTRVNGGINVAASGMPPALCTIDIAGGTLDISAAWGAPPEHEGTWGYWINQWIHNGYLLAYGHTPGTDGYDILTRVQEDGRVLVTATPEPATIALLCLGGLALIRRKRS